MLLWYMVWMRMYKMSFSGKRSRDFQANKLLFSESLQANFDWIESRSLKFTNHLFTQLVTDSDNKINFSQLLSNGSEKLPVRLIWSPPSIRAVKLRIRSRLFSYYNMVWIFGKELIIKLYRFRLLSTLF